MRDIGDDNVAQLLKRAYEPETPDPAFVLRVKERLLQTARQRAVAAAPVCAPRTTSTCHRLSWVLSTAALLALISIPLNSLLRTERTPLRSSAQPPERDASFRFLTARARPPKAPSPTLAVGQVVEMKTGERRRFALPDGSLLSVNQNTRATVQAERRVHLERGEVLVEVAPRTRGNGPFILTTPEREVAALGTRFDVRAEPAGTGVLVAQGQVRVSGLDTIIGAGQQLAPAADTPLAAPRLSHALDWTKELMLAAESPLVPASQYAGGALVAIDPDGQEAKLGLRKYHVDVHIEDGFARTTIDQTYFNHHHGRLEGTFYFPLPADASLSRLAMYVADGNNARLNEGGMAERDHARNVYETIVHSQRDPALLEWVDGSTFKMRVFPLEARQEKRIVLSYTQRLESLYGQARYRFPAGHSLPIVRDWSFHARVKHGASFSWTSDHPSLTSSRDGADLLLSAQAHGVKPDRDVQFSIGDPRGVADEAAHFAAAEHDGHQYLMLRFRPSLPLASRQANVKPPPRHWVFLCETSGDRDPLLARAQIEIIRTLLGQAEHDDTFALVAAAARVRRFPDTPNDANGMSTAPGLRVTPETVRAGIEFLEHVQLIGALDLGQALAATGTSASTDQARITHLVHVGSGVPAMGERREDVLAQRLPAGVRYVGVGVGKRWARGFMKAAAERSGGYFTQINPDEPISWRAFELFSTLNTPRLLNVQVTDPSGQLLFLCDTSLLTQGEELCAIARVNGEPGAAGNASATGALPESVVVSGVLDGTPFRRAINVDKVAEHAGYLPRTWARLEIDRLLAADSTKNKERIVALSKAMYVMSPFTSLLVLENEAMYKQYNIDRGRKDHWAMYPCPETIPVVTEPDMARVNLLQGEGDQKPVIGLRPPEQVLRTIVVRGSKTGGRDVLNQDELLRLVRAKPGDVWFDAAPPPLLMPKRKYDSGFDIYEIAYQSRIKDEYGYSGYGVSVRDEVFYPQRNDFFVPLSLDDRKWRRPEIGQVDVHFEIKSPMEGAILNAGFREKRPQARVGQITINEATRQDVILRQIPVFPGQILSYPDLRVAEKNLAKLNIFESRPEDGIRSISRVHDPESEYRHLLITLEETQIGSLLLGLGVNSDARLARFGPPVLSKMPYVNRLFKSSRYRDDRPNSNARMRELLNTSENLRMIDPEDLRNITERPLGREPERVRGGIDGTFSSDLDFPGPRDGELTRNRQELIYQRPSFNIEDHLYYDLVAHAPGMNTSEADIRAVLEAEVTPKRPLTLGKVDPKAKQLIERARSSGWRTLSVGEWCVTFDGGGRHVWERVLPLGLRERVVCDGQTLWHLYAELGIGARRTVSRFHRAEFARLAPWAIPPIEDLVRAAELSVAGADTIVMTPRGVEADVPHHCVHLKFADTRLVERRVLRMPEKKVVLRVTYARDGLVTAFDGEDKEVARQAFTLRETSAPALTPDLTGLVVLPLPLRSLEHVREALKWKPEQRVEDLDMTAALSLFASAWAGNDQGEAVNIFARRFHARGQHSIGFYTLLAATGVNLDPELLFLKVAVENHDSGDPFRIIHGPPQVYSVLAEHPHQPLARYLAFISNPQERQRAHRGVIPGPRNTLIRTLADFRLLYDRWHKGKALSGDDSERQAEREQALAYIRRDPTSVLSWALLGVLRDPTESASFHAALAEAYRPFEHRPGYAYSACYERAVHLFRTEQEAEARQLFQQLYAQGLAHGFLPVIDGTFRAALRDNDAWTELMRQTARRLIEDRCRISVIALAWQCRQVGDPALAEELVESARRDTVGQRERLWTTLAAVEYYREAGDAARALQVLQTLLGDDKLGRWPYLWRLGHSLVSSRENKEEVVPYLEKVLALEFERLPEVIDLRGVRADYEALLAHYQKMAEAMASLKVSPPVTFVARVVGMADRWRAIDQERSIQVCRSAAKILKLVRERDLAWDYLTTPLALRPNESEPWLNLARELSGEGEWRLADRAYAAAFDAEPTNAQLLWDRAQHLENAGAKDMAKTLYHRLATESWQPRFRWIQERAREHCRQP